MIIAQLISGLIAAAIGSLIGALLLRAASQWIVKEDVQFGKAYGTMLITSLINGFIGICTGLGIESSSNPDALVVPAFTILLIIGFFVQSGIISAIISTKFKSACLISITMYGIVFGIIAIVFGFLWISGSL